MLDKQAATKIIRETFEKPFDKGRFAYFAKNLLKIGRASCRERVYRLV